MSFVTREFKPFLERGLSPLIEFLASKKVNPNLITLAGFFLILLGSVALFYGLKVTALFLLGAGAVLDALDGAVARRMGVDSEFGAFLDSTVDRFSDALPFLFLAVRYGSEGEPWGVALSVLSLIASFGVSYSRARAEALGIYGLGGVFERTERWIVLLVGVALDLIPLALAVIFLGATLTTLQRIGEVRKTILRRGDY